MKIAKVDWIDTIMYEGVCEKKLKEAKPHLMTSVGYLLNEDDKNVYLCFKYDNSEPDSPNNDGIIIPKESIKKINRC